MPMLTDQFPIESRKDDPAQPALAIFSVTPSDTVYFAAPARKIRIGTGGAGTITVVDMNNTAVLISNIADGTELSGYIVRVNATGTTVSNITGWV